MIGTTEMRATTESRGGRLVATDGRELPLASVHLAAQAGGGIARTVLTQRFENPFDEPLHIRYLLPLPSDGAVSGFAFTLGEERVEGEVAPLAAARERFERALGEGRTAALLDQDRTSVFTQQVGNVPPRTAVIAEVTVDQPLRWLEEGAWEWRFPTVVGPRYQGEAGRVPDAARTSVPVASGELGVRATLALTIADRATGPVESPSHQLWREGTVHGLAEGSARLDRDLVVRWPVALPTVSASVLAARPEGDTHAGDAFALVTIAPPNEAGLAVARDLTFLIDTSGSMQGRPLAQAKRILAAMIDGLGPEDRLEMIEFGSAPRRWKAEPLPATEPTKNEALAWLEALHSSGGTEMRRAIIEALRPLRPGSQRQVVLVTDGYIGFEREIVETLLQKLPAGARLHTVGVGSSVNRSLTQAAARAGCGVEVIVGLEEDPERVIARLLARTTAPLVTDLVLEGSAIVESAPRRLPDLFVESPALFALRVRSQGGEVVLRGVTADGGFERRLAIPALAPGDGPRAIAALFAREKVEDLETHLTAGGDRTEIEKTIEATGVAFQIATRLTSWVAVSRSVTVEPGRAARTVEQPHERPHGVSVEALGLRAGFRPTSLSQARLRLKRKRAGAPTMSESLLESELFGYVKGSFTGQVSERAGLFEIARGGTVFLNRLERSSHSMQTRLLRVAEEGEVLRIGTRETIKLAVRIVFAMRGDPGTTLSPALHRFLATRILTLPRFSEGRSIDAVLRLDPARAGLDPDEASFLRAVHELATKGDPVLLVGEYRDAEAVARALHDLGRRTGPFVQEEFSGPEPKVPSSVVDGLNARQRKLMDHLRAHGSIGARAYCEMVGVSATTGSRDLKDLVQRGLLQIVGKGRAAAYALTKAAQS